MSQTTDTTSTFEFFQGTVSESSSLPRITVRRGGLMVITRAAVDLLGDDVSGAGVRQRHHRLPVSGCGSGRTDHRAQGGARREEGNRPEAQERGIGTRCR